MDDCVLTVYASVCAAKHISHTVHMKAYMIIFVHVSEHWHVYFLMKCVLFMDVLDIKVNKGHISVFSDLT